jgi:hypothetical protein
VSLTDRRLWRLKGLLAIVFFPAEEVYVSVSGKDTLISEAAGGPAV